jgi:hypothetical protein
VLGRRPAPAEAEVSPELAPGRVAPATVPVTGDQGSRPSRNATG